MSDPDKYRLLLEERDELKFQLQNSQQKCANLEKKLHDENSSVVKSEVNQIAMEAQVASLLDELKTVKEELQKYKSLYNEIKTKEAHFSTMLEVKQSINFEQLAIKAQVSSLQDQVKVAQERALCLEQANLKLEGELLTRDNNNQLLFIESKSAEARMQSLEEELKVFKAMCENLKKQNKDMVEMTKTKAETIVKPCGRSVEDYEKIIEELKVKEQEEIKLQNNALQSWRKKCESLEGKLEEQFVHQRTLEMEIEKLVGQNKLLSERNLDNPSVESGSSEKAVQMSLSRKRQGSKRKHACDIIDAADIKEGKTKPVKVQNTKLAQKDQQDLKSGTKKEHLPEHQRNQPDKAKPGKSRGQRKRAPAVEENTISSPAAIARSLRPWRVKKKD